MQPQVLAAAIAASLLAAIAMPDASSGIARAQTPEKVTVRFTWKLKGDGLSLTLGSTKADVTITKLTETDFRFKNNAGQEATYERVVEKKN